MSREGDYWEDPDGELSYKDRELLMAEDEALPQPETSITHKVIGVLFSLGFGALVAYLIVSASSWATWLIIPIGMVLSVILWYGVIRWIAWHPNRKV